MTCRYRSARPVVKSFALLGSVAAAFLLSSPLNSAKADETFHLIDTLHVPGAPLSSFDISWVDPVHEIYLLADRSNSAIDVFSTDTDHFLFQIATSAGTNGVLTAGNEVWAGDNASNVEVADLSSHMVVDTISTGGTARADELSYDPRDHMILIANDSDSPPFITFISTESGHAVLGKITMDGTNGAPLATNGIEQSQWSRKTGLFYLNIPEVNGIVGNGEVLAIDPKTLSIVNQFPVAGCEPGGMALGPGHDALIACSKSGTDNSARIINLKNGHQLAEFPKITGGDEAWFDPGDDHYFEAASNNPASNGGPGLGIVDADSKTFDQLVPTASGAHSVAAEPDTNHVFVPIKAGTVTDSNCTTGCIYVFGTHRDDHGGRGHDHDGDDHMASSE